MNFLDLIWLIPLFPVAGFIINGLFGKRMPKTAVGTIAAGAVLISFIFAAGAVYQLSQLPEHERSHQVTVYEWINAGPAVTTVGQETSFVVDWAFLLDPLSSVMVLVVTGIGFLIHVYSTGYMWEEDGFYRFFAYLNLFMFSMLTLILGSNYLMMFIGWEGVGLCSYLLIGYYFHKKSAGDAAKKAFVVNRVGDWGLAIGILLIFATFGSLDYQTVEEVIRAGVASGQYVISQPIFIGIALALFVGACGKSAQIPLYVWLPDAMEGPTPVSALIHAATMVTAGVYMVARSNWIYQMAPEALAVVAIVGVLTALFAASIGLVQNDIKRVLAYSTVSQLGYMFLALGVGAFAAGVFHLMTHAFFKALLFLGSGSVIHALSGEQEMPRMGGLKKHLPITYATMAIGCVAIAGIPPLAGFFSKDEILFETFAGGHLVLWVVAAITAGMTAFYMFRLLFLTFHGKERLTEHARHHLHESPPSMTVPLIVLAVLSVVGGWVGIPIVQGMNRIKDWLAPSLTSHLPAAAQAGHGAAAAGAHGVAAGAHHNVGLELTLMAVLVAVALAGIFVAWLFYVKNPLLPRALGERLKGLYRTLLHKWYIDEVYDAIVVRPLMALSNFLWRVWDVLVIDGIVNAVGSIVAGTGALLRLFQSGYVGTYAFFLVLGVLVLLAGAVAAAR